MLVEPQNKLVIDIAEQFGLPTEFSVDYEGDAVFEFCRSFQSNCEELGDDGVFDFVCACNGMAFQCEVSQGHVDVKKLAAN
jgi:hypothetical protein